MGFSDVKLERIVSHNLLAMHKQSRPSAVKVCVSLCIKIFSFDFQLSWFEWVTRSKVDHFFFFPIPFISRGCQVKRLSHLIDILNRLNFVINCETASHLSAGPLSLTHFQEKDILCHYYTLWICFLIHSFLPCKQSSFRPSVWFLERLQPS